MIAAPTRTTQSLRRALAADEVRARVYVTAWGRLDQSDLPAGNGRLAVLDARDVTLLRTVTIGVAPRAVAVQEDSGRVVVVDSGARSERRRAGRSSGSSRWRHGCPGWGAWPRAHRRPIEYRAV